MFDKESEIARDKCCHSRLSATTRYHAPKLTNPFGWRLAASSDAGEQFKLYCIKLKSKCCLQNNEPSDPSRRIAECCTQQRLVAKCFGDCFIRRHHRHRRFAVAPDILVGLVSRRVQRG